MGANIQSQSNPILLTTRQADGIEQAYLVLEVAGQHDAQELRLGAKNSESSKVCHAERKRIRWRNRLRSGLTSDKYDDESVATSAERWNSQR